jgi:hypothetical protein
MQLSTLSKTMVSIAIQMFWYAEIQYKQNITINFSSEQSHDMKVLESLSKTQKCSSLPWNT